MSRVRRRYSKVTNTPISFSPRDTTLAYLSLSWVQNPHLTRCRNTIGTDRNAVLQWQSPPPESPRLGLDRLAQPKFWPDTTALRVVVPPTLCHPSSLSGLTGAVPCRTGAAAFETPLPSVLSSRWGVSAVSGLSDLPLPFDLIDTRESDDIWKLQRLSRLRSRKTVWVG
jgi:hypothetical protein